MAATTVVNAAYDTSGNGGRKLVRLSNGWLIAATYDNSSKRIYFYRSIDNGQTWTQLCYMYTANSSYVWYSFALSSYGTKVFVIAASQANFMHWQSFDATTQTNTDIYQGAKTFDGGQSALGQCSLTINNAGTELHAAWASKNSTYPNSFNIRYAKGTIDGSGNVTWGSVTQITTDNNTSTHFTNPCVIVKNDKPVILFQLQNGTTYGIGNIYWNGTSWVIPGGNYAVVYNGNSYAQSNPCAVVDGNGVIHVVWHGMDSTDTSTNNIKYSKSTDGGVTWSTVVKLTTGNGYLQGYPSISRDNNNKLYVFWHGLDPAVSTTKYNIRKIVYDGSAWSSHQTITANTTNHAYYPNTMEKEAASMIGWIYRDDQTPSVKFDSITLNNTPTLTLTNPADNQTLQEGSTFNVQGSASDVDSGNVVTIKYKINNGTTRALSSGVSDGSSPISFAKTLTYHDKRIWDGTTDITGVDLAENTNHTLTVWAEDDQGGISNQETRTFTVIWNRPPMISGTDTDLGTINTPPTVSYSVTEPEGNTFTITEYLNGVQKNTFSGVDGQTYSFTIDHDTWIRLDLDVLHQIKIRATDSEGLYSDRIFTFIRTETHIEFILDYDNPNVVADFTLDAMPERVLVTLDRYMPAGSSIEFVKVCNNALDATPTWEDATGAVNGGRGYLFTNTTKTATDWAINIWVSINKGTATERVLLNGHGGAFD